MIVLILVEEIFPRLVVLAGLVSPLLLFQEVDFSFGSRPSICLGNFKVDRYLLWKLYVDSRVGSTERNFAFEINWPDVPVLSTRLGFITLSRQVFVVAASRCSASDLCM